MGLLSRTKGKVFERKVARAFRKRWPDAIVRRASQAERAHESDVFITGGPPILSRLWLECQDARNPTPLAKLEQAEQDIGFAHNPGWRDTSMPIVVWHKLGAREINVSTRTWMFDELRGMPRGIASDAVLTMTLDDFLDVLTETRAKGAA